MKKVFLHLLMLCLLLGNAEAGGAIKQKEESRKLRTESGKQKEESRKQRTESGKKKAESSVSHDLEYCSAQVERALKALQQPDGSFNYAMEPRNILKGETAWNCRRACAEEWCSGFWPGVLWMNYGYLKSRSDVKAERLDSLRQAAEGFTNVLSFLGSQPAYDHDLGFLVINSFLKGYEQTGNETYRRIALAAADTLATLYNNKVGTSLSWPRHVKDYGGHNTIMDNMINLELLFWASENGGSKRLRDMAIKHAETTMLNHFREDGSCYHVAVYDTLTGRFIKGVTHQGYADWSMWSRGQSWAIYGYTMVYRFTHDKRFLEHAQKVTDIYLKRLHETSNDWVPLWDMDEPEGSVLKQKEESRKQRKAGKSRKQGEEINRKQKAEWLGLKDASAACVVASALIELQAYVDEEKAKKYREVAEGMLRDLSNRYQSGNENVAFLLHSTGHRPARSEMDASIIYADYYYIEALTRWQRAVRQGRWPV